MEIKIKLLHSERYKDDDAFDEAIERWKLKGWELADVAQTIDALDEAVAILWRVNPITQ